MRNITIHSTAIVIGVYCFFCYHMIIAIKINSPQLISSILCANYSHNLTEIPKQDYNNDPFTMMGRNNNKLNINSCQDIN